MVSDTAEMANPQFDCTAVNSCPNRPVGQGTTDPIHNIMVRAPRPANDEQPCKLRWRERFVVNDQDRPPMRLKLGHPCHGDAGGASLIFCVHAHPDPRHGCC